MHKYTNTVHAGFQKVCQQALVSLWTPRSSHLLRADHDFGDEVDDGAGGLLGVVLREHVTHVLQTAARFPRHKPEDPAAGRTRLAKACFNPLLLNLKIVFLWIFSILSMFVYYQHLASVS